MIGFVLASALAVAAAPPPATDEQAEKKKLEEQAEKRKLEEEMARQLGGGAQGAAAPAPPPAASGGSALGRLLLLPDVSALGRGGMFWNRLDAGALSPRAAPVAPPGKLEPVFEELELALQAVVDPFARADVFLSFGPDGAAVEEAYLTTLALPGGLQARAGTLFAPFGRLNQQHPHVWDFADGPLAMARLVAEEALEGPGLDLAWLAPLPWFAEVHLAYQKTTPAGEAQGRRTGTARLVQYLDLADWAALGAGVSAARLEDPGRGAWRDLYGGDLFLKLRDPASRSYVALQGELFARRLSGQGDPAADGTRLGGYAQVLWRASREWAAGARWESAPGGGTAPPGAENRVAALAAYFPSEFLRVRLQTAWDRLPGGQGGLEALLAFDFSIGAHGAHPF